MAATDSSAIKQTLKEWHECRDTIGRFDTILVDLRKFGFTVCTTLLTADTFLSGGAGGSAARAGSMAVIAIMILIDALFALDTYYQSLEYGAVQRAVEIENQLQPPLQITKYLCSNARITSRVTMALYLALIVVAGGIAVAVQPADSLLPLYIPVGTGVASVIFVIGYWLGAGGRHRVSDRELGRPLPMVPAQRHSST